MESLFRESRLTINKPIINTIVNVGVCLWGIGCPFWRIHSMVAYQVNHQLLENFSLLLEN